MLFLLHSISHYELEIIGLTVFKASISRKGRGKKKRKKIEIMLWSFAIKINFDGSVSVTLLWMGESTAKV